MPTLQLDLREGFDGELVTVRVAGREVYRKSGVRTNYSVGIADRIHFDIPAGPVEVEVALPDRGVRRIVTHHPGNPATLAFSLEPDGKLTHQEIDTAARYL